MKTDLNDRARRRRACCAMPGLRWITCPVCGKRHRSGDYRDYRCENCKREDRRKDESREEGGQ